MANLTVFILLGIFCVVASKPLENIEKQGSEQNIEVHNIQKRFINTALASGGFDETGIKHLRAKRSDEEECEKLQLCKLHARSRHSFFAAFELYFVNRENARLWDHHAHSEKDCEQRFSCYRK